MKKFSLSLLFTMIGISITSYRLAYAQTTSPVQQNIEPFSYCPDISQIQKNSIKMNWSAHTQAGYWKSYHMSFATKLIQFMGAEWQGEAVGQIYCLYSAEQQFMMNGTLNTQTAIPVALFFHTLTLTPTGGRWQPLQEGAMLCKSAAQSDCPFTVHVKQSVGDIFKEAEALKDQQSQTVQEPTN